MRPFLLLLCVGFAGCAPSPSPALSAPAPSPSVAATGTARDARDRPLEYRSVHIDTILPGLFAQFEGARRDWLSELTRAKATDGRGVFIQIGDGCFYTMRSFSKFGDFDTRGEAIAKSMASVPKAAGERYDELSDTALAFPHTSEIWELDDDLSYLPQAGALTERTAACGRLLIEDVRPDTESSKRYSDATVETNHALGEASYPLTRLTFRTVFGAGHLMTFWLAKSKEDLDAAPDVQASIAKTRGDARAGWLAAACAASVAKTQTFPIVVRHDLTQ